MVGGKNWIIILILALALIQPRAEAYCEYTFEVKTGDEHGAGTDARISFRLCDAVYRCRARSVDSSSDWEWGTDQFERGQLDTFKYIDWHSGCIDPCVLTVQSNRAGDYPAWYVEWVRVTTHDQSDTSAEHTFNFNTWVGEEGQANYAIVNHCNSLNLGVKATAA